MEQTINLKNLYDQLERIEKTMITKSEIDNFIETLIILSNPNTMNQINSSERDIMEEDIREINSVNDL